MTTEELITLVTDVLEREHGWFVSFVEKAPTDLLRATHTKRRDNLRAAIELVKTVPGMVARLRAAEELIAALDAERFVEGDFFNPGTVEEQKAATLTEIRASVRVAEKRAAGEKVKS